jgi:two-component system chemotaxis response regulator CheY
MSKTVLIVDDCQTTRKLVGLCLKKMGYLLLQAENGLDALEKLARGPVDLVITDMNMPQMDGVALTSSLKQDQTLQGIPVLMLSSESAEKERESGLAAGAAAYLIKPVSQERLEQEVKKLLAVST